MSKHDISVTLRQMRDFAEKTRAMTAGRQLQDLQRDDMLRLALERALEVLGEAASRLPDDFRSRYAHIPWRQMIGMRNVLAHGYDVVRDEVLLDTATLNVPELLKQLEAMLSDLENSDAE